MKRFWSVACLLSLLLSSCSYADDAKAQNVAIQLDGKELIIHLPKSKSVNSNLIERLVAQAIKQDVLDAKIKEAGMVVTPGVLSKCLDLYFASGGLSAQDAESLSAKQEMIVDALKRVVLRGEDKANVYDTRLKGSINREEWEVWVTEYNNKAKIEKLESLIPHSLQEMKQNSKQSLKKELEAWLLFDRISRRIVPSDADIATVYEKMYPTGTPPFSEVEKQVREQATAELRHQYLSKWWDEEMTKHSVEVPSEYKKAIALTKALPRPALPQTVIQFLGEIAR